MDASLLDDIYKNIPKHEIPWIHEYLPQCLDNLVVNKIIHPCKLIDLGCGIGTYTLCFAKLAYDVYGFDISKTAVKLANELFKKNKLTGHFYCKDLTKPVDLFYNQFEFAFDYGVLHHIFPKYREQFFKNAFNLLKDKGKYLSVCFSEEDDCFGSKEKYRETPLKTILYFSSEDEIRLLASPLFEIMDLTTIDIEGKLNSHKAIYCLMQKKSSAF